MSGLNKTGYVYGVEYSEDALDGFVTDRAVPEYVIALTTYSWITVCNIFLIAAILTNKTTRKKISSRLIINQSIADVLVGLFGFRLTLAEDIFGLNQETASLEKIIQYFCLLLHYFAGTCFLCSIIMMFFINLERYLFICQSVWYRVNMRLRQIFYMAGLAWLMSALSAIPLLVHLANKVKEYGEIVGDNDICRTAASLPEPKMFIFWSVGYIFVPLPAIIFFNVKIFQTARSHTTRMARRNVGSSVEMRPGIESASVGEEQSQDQDGQHARQNVHETQSQSRRIVRTLFLFNVFFVVMWMPVVLLNMFIVIFPEVESLYGKEIYITRNVFFWIASMNSSVNPFLWIMYPDYRRAYWQLLTRACKK